MKNLRKFETIDEFTSAYTGDGYIEPWVSYTEENGGTNYNKANWAKIDLNRWSDELWDAMVDYGDTFDNSEDSIYYVKHRGSSEEVVYEGGPGYIRYGTEEFYNVRQSSCDSAVSFEEGAWHLYQQVC